MRVFSPIIEAFMLPMLDPRHDLPLRRAVAGKLVGDHDAWRPHLLFQ
jgi:hypothetical protein